MKKSDIEVGGCYVAKVRGELVKVMVKAMQKRKAQKANGRMYKKGGVDFLCTNLDTGDEVVFPSAARFRYEATPPLPGGGKTGPVKAPQASPASNPANYRGEAPKSRQAGPQGARKTGGLLARRLAARNEPVEAPHLIVEARAGTGKTTTLLEGLRYVQGGESRLTPSPQQEAVWNAMKQYHGKVNTIAMAAFNRSIAKELRNRVPQGVKAMTMHGMGFKAVTSTFKLLPGDDGVSGWKVKNLIAELLNVRYKDLMKDKPDMVLATAKLVGLCKMNLLMGSVQDLDKLTSHYEVELGDHRAQIYDMVPQLIDRCMEVDRDKYIDYNDQIWLPIILDLPLARYDLLLVDEAQDLSRCQQELAMRASKKLIMCGDPKQAIYGFAGADSSSMARMQKRLEETEFGCKVLPLTMTFRCGKNIVKAANKYVPDLEAHPKNPEGKVYRRAIEGPPFVTAVLDDSGNWSEDGIRPSQLGYRHQVKDGDMVLCRVNAPLVQECFKFLKEGRKATIQGRDIGKNLISTINRMKCHSVVDLVEKLDEWRVQEMRMENAKQNPSEAKLLMISDRHACLMCFCEGCNTIEEVIGRIESVFTDSQSVGVLLSSIHKAKGLEASRVFFLMPDYAPCPHPMAKTPMAREQEFNLLYVGMTRAIHELVHVS